MEYGTTNAWNPKLSRRSLWLDSVKEKFQYWSFSALWLLQDLLYLVSRISLRQWLAPILLVAPCVENHVVRAFSWNLLDAWCLRYYQSTIIQRVSDFPASDGGLRVWVCRRCWLLKIRVEERRNTLRVPVTLAAIAIKVVWYYYPLAVDAVRRQDSRIIAQLSRTVHEVLDFPT